MSEPIGLLERTWFKCRTCGIECSTEVLATWHNPYSDQVESWDQCTNCTLVCDACDEPVNPAGCGIHSGHPDCWAMFCEVEAEWKELCPGCNLCPSCEHCSECETCWDECDC